MDNIRIKLKDSIENFLVWYLRNGNATYDQYDLWSTSYGKFSKEMYYRYSKLAAPLVLPLMLADIVLPGIRTIFAKKKIFPIAIAHLIMGYINLYKAEKENAYLDKAKELSEQLLSISIEGYSGLSWGYPFDWETVVGRFPSQTPLITTVPYCFDAFRNLYEVTSDEKYLEILRSISNFVMNDLNEIVIDNNSSSTSYTPLDKSMVINANSYRAALLVGAYDLFNEDDLLREAKKNTRFVLDNQSEDGSWRYSANASEGDFTDNFHTCFILKNLYRVKDHLFNDETNSAIRSGYSYYKDNLLNSNGLPKPFSQLSRPHLVKLELYDFAEGVNLGLLLSNSDSEAYSIAENLLNFAIDKLQMETGYFVTRIYVGGYKNKIPYMRWAQSQMFNAFTLYYSKIMEN